MGLFYLGLIAKARYYEGGFSTAPQSPIYEIYIAPPPLETPIT
jgi:hypothetical protein